MTKKAAAATSENANMSDVLIFTHFGASGYLAKTLECAATTNPTINRILIGDDENRRIAEAAGWKFCHFDDIDSASRREFARVFRWVQGARHNPIRNGVDWLRYVFERWFVVEAYCRQNSVDSFWHFDSDVMILTSLDRFARSLNKDQIEFTRQCNDTCLNGFVNLSILSEFCGFTVDVFKNERFLADQQREFDEQHQDWAFSEMRAFEAYYERWSFPGTL